MSTEKQSNKYTEEDVCRIKDFQIGELPKNSNFVRPFRATFIDEGSNHPVKRLWDAVEEHNSVVIIIYNRSTDALVLVRQFRPAVHVMISKETQNATSISDIDFTKHNPKSAITYEFCAGIIDKEHLTSKQHAHAEIFEECGFEVDIDSIETVAKYRIGVGIAGANQELFYVEVTNDMKKDAGGGNASEQEMIVVQEVPVNELYPLLFDETKQKKQHSCLVLCGFYIKKDDYHNVRSSFIFNQQ